MFIWVNGWEIQTMIKEFPNHFRQLSIVPCQQWIQPECWHVVNTPQQHTYHNGHRDLNVSNNNQISHWQLNAWSQLPQKQQGYEQGNRASKEVEGAAGSRDATCLEGLVMEMAQTRCLGHGWVFFFHFFIFLLCLLFK